MNVPRGTSVGRRDVIFVLGKTGMGKSVWTRNHVAGLDRLICYDPFASIPGTRFCVDNDSLYDAYDAARENPRYNFGSFRADDVPVLADMAFVLGNGTLILEEISSIFQNSRKLVDWARNMIFLGRHQNCSLVLIAQRAASIPIDFRSQATRVVSFAQTEARDQDWLKDYLGDRTDELTTLAPLECLDFDIAQAHGVQRYSINFEKSMPVEETGHDDVDVLDELDSHMYNEN